MIFFYKESKSRIKKIKKFFLWWGGGGGWGARVNGFFLLRIQI